MNNRIKIYATLLGAVYLFILLTFLVVGFEDMKRGFMDGVKGVSYNQHANDKDEAFLTFWTRIEPISKANTNENVEKVDGKLQSFEPTAAYVKVELPKSEVPTSYFVFDGVMTVIFAFPLVLILGYIPMLFCQIVHSVIKNGALDSSVVRRTLRMGWMLIIFFAIYTLSDFGDAYFAKQIIELQDYKILYPEPDFILLMLGLLTLFLGEVLKMSWNMKADQDLTI